jgi:hypothetical protein
MTDTEKTIGGRRFRFGILPAEDAFDVLAVVAKNFGASLGAVLSGGVPEAEMLGALTAGLNVPEVKSAIKTLLGVTACLDQEGGGRCDFNRTFTGNVLQLLQVAVEAFKVNFHDFLAAVPSRSSEAPAAK